MAKPQQKPKPLISAAFDQASRNIAWRIGGTMSRSNLGKLAAGKRANHIWTPTATASAFSTAQVRSGTRGGLSRAWARPNIMGFAPRPPIQAYVPRRQRAFGFNL